MSIVIIEPHADDAILACSSILNTADILITVFDDRSSERLIDFFPNLKIISLGVPHDIGPAWGDRIEPASVLDCYKRGVNPNKVYSTLLKDLNEVDIIAHRLSEYIRPDDMVYTILGVWHPQHMLCRLATQQVPSCLTYYAEPSARYKRVGQLMERAAVKYLDVTLLKPKKPYALKMEAFKKVYPTETYLIRGKDLESDYTEDEVFWR